MKTLLLRTALIYLSSELYLGEMAQAVFVLTAIAQSARLAVNAGTFEQYPCLIPNETSFNSTGAPPLEQLKSRTSVAFLSGETD